MKKFWMGCLLLLALCSAAIAAEKVEAPDDCKHCGMNRTKVAKWAFADKKAADAFIRHNGGKIATYDEALKMAEGEHSGKSGPGHKSHGEHKM